MFIPFLKRVKGEGELEIFEYKPISCESCDILSLLRSSTYKKNNDALENFYGGKWFPILTDRLSKFDRLQFWAGLTHKPGNRTILFIVTRLLKQSVT